MVCAVERVGERLRRATAALEAAGVPYAVAGGNAVAAWVALVDPAAVRNTQDVDILLRRADLEAAARALEAVGFVRRHVAGVEMFLDGHDGRTRDAVRITFAGETGRRDDLAEAPDVGESERFEKFSVVSLEPLVRMSLGALNAENAMHLRDMLDVGLIDASWPARFPSELAVRLQHLIDTPEG
jgi:hypothetical protein